MLWQCPASEQGGSVTHTGEHEGGPTNANVSLARGLQELLERTVAHEPYVRGGVLLLEAPARALKWKGASGMADPDKGSVMLPDDQFRVASITKMVTATTVLTLAEVGKLELDARLDRYLPAEITTDLHLYEGGSYGPEITLRQLLSHTSGLVDFFGDGEPSSDGFPPFVQMMVADPGKFWEPLEVLEWTKENLPPRFLPGEGWHYSDTGYLLSGLVVEAVSGKELHQVFKEKIFDPLGMDHSYVVFREESRLRGGQGREPARAYMEDVDYTSLRSVSADWAGGGLVSTVEDLNRFLRAFVEDKVFRDPSAKQEMLSWVPTGEQGVYYGLGVRRFMLEELGIAGFGEVWGHTGFLNAFMLYWPEQDATIVGTLNQQAAKGVWSRVRPVSCMVPEVMRKLNASR